MPKFFEASLTNAIPFSLPTCLMVVNEEYSMRNKVPTYDSQSFSNWNKGHKKNQTTNQIEQPTAKHNELNLSSPSWKFFIVKALWKGNAWKMSSNEDEEECSAKGNFN